jgi:hypothetical protein
MCLTKSVVFKCSILGRRGGRRWVTIFRIREEGGMEEGGNGGWMIEMDVGYEMTRRERHQSVDVYLSFEDSGRFMIRRIY